MSRVANVNSNAQYRKRALQCPVWQMFTVVNVLAKVLCIKCPLQHNTVHDHGSICPLKLGWLERHFGTGEPITDVGGRGSTVHPLKEGSVFTSILSYRVSQWLSEVFSGYCDCSPLLPPSLPPPPSPPHPGCKDVNSKINIKSSTASNAC